MRTAVPIGSGGLPTIASTSTGDALGIVGFLEILSVPHDYVSRTPLSGAATWDDTTLAALGVTPGTYTWTWGSGANADLLTLVVAPEPAPALLLTLGVAGLALLKWRFSIRCASTSNGA